MAGRQNPRRPDPEDQFPMPDLEAYIGYNLKRAYVILQKDFREALGADGLAPRDFSALALVVQFPNITQSELARMLGIERSGLVAIVDELEGRGYLSRAAVPGDRRVHALVPTPTGIAACARATEQVKAHEEKLLSHMTQDEIQMLGSLLRKIRARGEET